MKKQAKFQYTIREVSSALDVSLKRRAQQEDKSLNSLILEILESSAGIGGTPTPKKDLNFMAGTWIEDPKVEKALKEQRQIVAGDW